LQHELSAQAKEQFARLAKTSLKKQKNIEQSESQSLDDFIQGYFDQYQRL
jgi:hypothetical protein